MVKQKQNQQKKVVKKRFLQGFSLLELLVVIGLLGVVAMAATTLIIDTGEEKRKDATEKNWDAIRKAIIGDSTLSLNGSPMLSGYVADMGRLPNNIKELMSREYDFDDDNNVATPAIHVEQPEWKTAQLSVVDTGVSGTISGGWRGPYLYTVGSKEFRDGWPKKITLPDDDVNFGWSVSHTLATATPPAALGACSATDCPNINLAIISLGEGNTDDATDPPNANDSMDYSADFPASSATLAVSTSDWHTTTALNFDVVINKPSIVPTVNALELRIYNFEDDEITDASGTNGVEDSIKTRLAVFNLTNTTVYPISLNILKTDPVEKYDYLPVGRYAAVVMCTKDTANNTVDFMYDGDCETATLPSVPLQPYYFVVLPSTTKVTIPWNIP